MHLASILRDYSNLKPLTSKRRRRRFWLCGCGCRVLSGRGERLGLDVAGIGNGVVDVDDVGVGVDLVRLLLLGRLDWAVGREDVVQFLEL